MEHDNKSPAPVGSFVLSAVVSFGTITVAHLLMTLLFWLCLNPTLKAFGLKAIGFGTCFGIWTAWLMVVLVPALVILNIIKSMWPSDGDLLVKMLSSYKNGL